MAEETEVVDGPNDEGEMFERPGKASDTSPRRTRTRRRRGTPTTAPTRPTSR